METPTVLIISDDVDFSRAVTTRWQMERNVPTFTLLSGDLWPRFAVDVFDVAIVGRLRRDLLSVVLEPLHSTGQPIFCVCHDSTTAQLVRERWPRVSLLRPSEHWLETLVLAAAESSPSLPIRMPRPGCRAFLLGAATRSDTRPLHA